MAGCGCCREPAATAWNGRVRLGEHCDDNAACVCHSVAPVCWQSALQHADVLAVLVAVRRANATEISSAMHELGALQRHTDSLRQQLLANNGELQAAGAAFAARLEEVQGVTALQQGMADARKVGASIAVLCCWGDGSV